MTALTPRVLAVTVAAPLLSAAITVAVIALWLPELPERVATHWGLDGPDGYGPVWGAPLLVFGVLAAFSIFVVVFIATTARDGLSVVHKLVASVTAYLSVFMPVLMLGSLAGQRGLADPTRAPDVAPWIGVSLVAGLAAGAVAWFVLPKAVLRRSEAHPAEPLPIAASERVAWFGVASLTRGGVATIALVIAVTLVVSVVAVIASRGAAAALLLAPLALIVLALTSSRWHVRIDASGLTAVGGFGLPRVRVPLAQIESAAAIRVDPVAEFGGWGPRWSLDGRFGIVLRRGEALEVRRTGKRLLVITIDDAATAAATIATLRARVTG